MGKEVKKKKGIKIPVEKSNYTEEDLDRLKHMLNKTKGSSI